MYYNFAAESFLSKKLCSRLHSTKIEFYSKLDNDGIPTSNDSDDLLDFSNSCLLLAHVRSDVDTRM